MTLRRLAARLAILPIVAFGVGIGTTTQAAAGGFCYSYNYSDHQRLSNAVYEYIDETVSYSMAFDCYGRALSITVNRVQATYAVLASPHIRVWHQAHSTQVNRYQYYGVVWDDSYGPGWYNYGWRSKDEYPNVTLPYDYYANTLSGMWQCGVQHATDCTFRHFFVAGYAQNY